MVISALEDSALGVVSALEDSALEVDSALGVVSAPPSSLLCWGSRRHFCHIVRTIYWQGFPSLSARSISSKKHCPFFRSNLTFSLSSASLPQKKAPRHHKKDKITTMTKPPPHPDCPIVPPTRSPMPKLISHRPPPTLPCAPTNRRSHIYSAGHSASL